MNKRQRKKLARDFADVLKSRPIYGTQLRYALRFGGDYNMRNLWTCRRVSDLFTYFETRSHGSKFEEFTKFYPVSKASGTHDAAGKSTNRLSQSKA